MLGVMGIREEQELFHPYSPSSIKRGFTVSIIISALIVLVLYGKIKFSKIK